MPKFQIGDVVMLKSGGPAMTVTNPAVQLMGSDATAVAVTWFANLTDKTPTYGNFAEALLDKV